MKRISVPVALLGSLAVACAPRPRPGSTMALSGCVLPGPAGTASVQARCGSLRVPERHDRPDGASISLRVAVVPAASGEPARDAVVFLPGGPGQAASEQLPELAPALAEVARTRDVLAVDQRGTGGSGRLRCPDEGELSDLDSPTVEDEVAYVRACARALRLDAAAYTTDESARDLEDVRAALGYEQLDLVGVSYGSRLALDYARLFPGRVRTLVLDGVAPVEVAIGADADRNAGAALAAIAARCARQPSCAERLGGFVGELEGLVGSLAARPRRLAVADPRTGAPVDLTFTATLLRRTVLFLSYASETAALLPLVVHEAATRDGVRRLAAQGTLVAGELSRSVSEPLYLSVICAEDVPFYGPSTAPRGFLGEDERARLEALCASWPHARVAPSWKEPVESDAPALLVSGSADPVTPPRYGDLAAQHLGRSIHLVLRGQGHGNLARGCLPRLVASFVESGGLGRLDTSCARAIEPLAFFIDGGGPPP